MFEDVGIKILIEKSSAEQLNIKDGLGINQIDARIQMMKGEFNIESSLNEGTKITVILPIVEKEAFSHV